MAQPKTPLSDLSQIEANWLTATLTANGHLTQGCVAHVRCEMLKKSKYSDIAQLQVSYSADARISTGGMLPATLLLKLGKSSSAPQRNALFARREFEFYSRIAPAMKASIAACSFDAAFEQQTGRYHFLLEDLTGTHTHVANPLPPSIPECEQIVECLARLHAAWWNDPRIGKEIGKPFVEERHSKRASTIKKRTGKFLELLDDRIAGSRRNTLRDLPAVYPRLLERQGRGHLTITHGDAHAQNFLISRMRADCRIIDWEAWEVAPATDDLAFMMAVLWFSERRKRLERELLRRYHGALVAAGVGNYSWDSLWSDYQLSAIKHLCTPVYQWINGVRPAVWLNNLERILTSYEDLGCAELMEELKH